jgi:hypothetical protein
VLAKELGRTAERPSSLRRRQRDPRYLARAHRCADFRCRAGRQLAGTHAVALCVGCARVRGDEVTPGTHGTQAWDASGDALGRIGTHRTVEPKCRDASGTQPLARTGTHCGTQATVASLLFVAMVSTGFRPLARLR